VRRLERRDPANLDPPGTSPQRTPDRIGDDPTTPAAKLRRNLFLALDLLEETMMGKALDGNVRDKRLAVEAAMATIKAFISANRKR
jgi:hypothetical protein